MQIIAHRGASAYKPENSLEAFREAARLGSDFFEADVHLTRDGALALWHDYQFEGRVIKKGLLRDFPLATLKELLDILPPAANLNIEIKNDGNIYEGIERAVLGLLQTYPPPLKERILISSFDYPTLQRVRALDTDIKIGVLTRDFDVSAALALRACSVNISFKRVNAEIVKSCHKNNLKVYVYTVNTPAEAAVMASLGVDAIFSDYPDLLPPKY
jgi:glycerophosphoryl diester phosphodiesterase